MHCNASFWRQKRSARACSLLFFCCQTASIVSAGECHRILQMQKTETLVIPGAHGDLCVKDQVKKIQICAPDKSKIISFKEVSSSRQNFFGNYSVNKFGEDCIDVFISGHSADHRYILPSLWVCGQSSYSVTIDFLYCDAAE
jgi:hypothetical protein